MSQCAHSKWSSSPLKGKKLRNSCILLRTETKPLRFMQGDHANLSHDLDDFIRFSPALDLNGLQKQADEMKAQSLLYKLYSVIY
ncbi:hypothetical protein ACROYT_G042919 [Oculina patagonica]